MEINSGAERGTEENRVMAPTLIFDLSDTITVMQEEIFGPLLPVVSYRTLAAAIAFVNARLRPLALYYFDPYAQRVDRLLERTLSGGVTLNDCLFQLAQHNLPFGDVGPSGMGHYHGFDGFATFSKKRSVMIQRRWSLLALLRVPYRRPKRAIMGGLLGLARRPR